MAPLHSVAVEFRGVAQCIICYHNPARLHMLAEALTMLPDCVRSRLVTNKQTNIHTMLDEIAVGSALCISAQFEGMVHQKSGVLKCFCICKPKRSCTVQPCITIFEYNEVHIPARRMQSVNVTSMAIMLSKWHH